MGIHGADSRGLSRESCGKTSARIGNFPNKLDGVEYLGRAPMSANPTVAIWGCRPVMEESSRAIPWLCNRRRMWGGIWMRPHMERRNRDRVGPW